MIIITNTNTIQSLNWKTKNLFIIDANIKVIMMVFITDVMRLVSMFSIIIVVLIFYVIMQFVLFILRSIDIPVCYWYSLSIFNHVSVLLLLHALLFYGFYGLFSLCLCTVKHEKC